MKQILLRHANDDYTAMLIASGMTKAGADVFSITNNGPAHPRDLGARILEDHNRPQKFIVWARVRDGSHIDECDKAITECLNVHTP